MGCDVSSNLYRETGVALGATLLVESPELTSSNPMKLYNIAPSVRILEDRMLRASPATRRQFVEHRSSPGCVPDAVLLRKQT